MKKVIQPIAKAQSSVMPKPINICFIIDDLGVGGTEKYVLTLIRTLAGSNFRSYLCVLDGSGELSQELEPDNIAVLRLGVRSLFGFRTLAAMHRLAKFFRENEIHLVQSQFANSSYLGIISAMIGRVRCVIKTRRDLVYWTTKKQKIFGPTLDRILNRWCVSAFIVNSTACQLAVLNDEKYAHEDRVALIRNGIEVTSFESRCEALRKQIDIGQWTVGILSQLRPEKTVDVFVKAAAIVAKHCSDVEFVIAGEGPCRAQIVELISSLHLEKIVQLVGHVSDVPGFLAQIHVGVLSSATEGSPNAVLEYMAAGRAIVATNVGGTPELIEHGRTGLLVPPQQPELFAEAIMRLLRDRPMACRMAEQAQLVARAKHDLNKTTQAHERFYRHILALTPETRT